MKPSLHHELNDRLSRYLAGQIDLSEFHDWFIPASWDIDAESQQFKRLAHRLQLLLAEFSNGDRDEQDLRNNFWSLLERASVTVTIGQGLPASSSTSVTSQVVVPAARPVGTGHAVAHV